MIAKRGDLVAALQDAGFSWLDADDANRIVDAAVQEVVDEDLWRWRVREAQGAAPLVVAGLGPIQTVTDPTTDRPVWPRSRAELQRKGYDLEAGGPARFYYLEGDTVHVWPTGGTILVHHYGAHGWTNGGALAADDLDTPILPDRRRGLLELVCRRLAHEFNSVTEDAAAVQGQIDRALERARAADLQEDVDEPMVIETREEY